MAKRFTDSRKFRDPWFRRLPPTYKCFWFYLLDECNHAGIWKADFELASFSIGDTVDAKEAHTLLKDRIKVLSDETWFVPKFIDFQYGELNRDNRAHNSVMSILKKEGAYKGLTRSCQGRKDKDKDKDKDINRRFDEIWNLYPKRVGRKKAYSHFRATIKNDQDFLNIKTALKNYLQSKRVSQGYIQNGETWFNNWDDWIGYTERACPKCKDKGKFISTTGYEIVCDCPIGKGR